MANRGRVRSFGIELRRLVALRGRCRDSPLSVPPSARRHLPKLRQKVFHTRVGNPAGVGRRFRDAADPAPFLIEHQTAQQNNPPAEKQPQRPARRVKFMSKRTTGTRRQRSPSVPDKRVPSPLDSLKKNQLRKEPKKHQETGTEKRLVFQASTEEDSRSSDRGT